MVMGFKWIKWMFFFVVWVLCFFVASGGVIKKQFPRGWETAFAI